MKSNRIVRPGGQGRLVALAERCASEGQMNLNKLLEAAVYAMTRRAGWRYRPPVTRDAMLQELESAIRQLRDESPAPALVGMLEAGLQALIARRGSDLLTEEAPDVFVCRTWACRAGNRPTSVPTRLLAGPFPQVRGIFSGDNRSPQTRARCWRCWKACRSARAAGRPFERKGARRLRRLVDPSISPTSMTPGDAPPVWT
jgi:hypothetical protein